MLSRSRELGATHTVNPRTGDALVQLLDIRPGGLNYTLETVERHPNLPPAKPGRAADLGAIALFASTQAAQLARSSIYLTVNKYHNS
jgi:hypothetical protein